MNEATNDMLKRLSGKEWTGYKTLTLICKLPCK